MSLQVRLLPPGIDHHVRTLEPFPRQFGNGMIGGGDVMDHRRRLQSRHLTLQYSIVVFQEIAFPGLILPCSPLLCQPHPASSSAVAASPDYQLCMQPVNQDAGSYDRS
jgi:hypothetical protein